MYGTIKIGDEMFQIIRTTNMLYEPLIQKWNEASPNHRTFKKDERLYFCITIEDAILVEDEPEVIVEENLEDPKI